LPPVPGVGGRAGTPTQIKRRFPTRYNRLPGQFETIPQQQARLTRDPAYVRDLQRLLRAAGFNVAVDGKWGPQTSRAYHSYVYLSRQRGVTLQTKGAAAAVAEYQRKVARDQAAFQRGLQGIQRAMRGEDALTREASIARFIAGFTGESGIFREQAEAAAKRVKTLGELETGQARESAALAAAQARQAAEAHTFLGRVKSAAGTALEAGVRLAGLDTAPARTLLEFPSRFGYAFQRSLDLQTAQDLRRETGGGPSIFERLFVPGVAFREAREAFDETLGAFGEAVFAGAASATRTAGLLPEGTFARTIAEATDDRAERDQLALTRQMESFGQRFARDLMGREHTMKAARELGRQQGLTGRALEDYATRRTERLRRAFLLSAGRPEAGYGQSSYEGSVISRVGDFSYQLLFDPTLVLGKGVRPLLIISDAAKAERFASTAAGRAIIGKAATQAARAGANRDVSLLLKTVRGLDNAAAQESKLVSALTDPTGGKAREYLARYINARPRRGPNQAAAEKAQNEARTLAQQLGDGPLDEQKLAALLTFALGREWKPLISLPTRVAQGVGQVALMSHLGTVDGIQEVLQQMPLWTRSAHTYALSHHMRRTLRGTERRAYLGRRLADDPTLRNIAPYLRRFAEDPDYKDLKAALDQISRVQVGVTKAGAPKLKPGKAVHEMAVRQVNAATYIGLLPPSAMRDALIRRLEGVRAAYQQEIDDIAARMTPAQQALFGQDPDWLKALRDLRTASAFKTFGTPMYAKWAQAVNDVTAVMERFGRVKLSQELHQRFAQLEKDVAVALRTPQEAYDLAEQAFLRDVAAYREMQRFQIGPDQMRGLAGRGRQRLAKVLLAPFDMYPTKLTASIENVETTAKLMTDYARYLGASEAEAGEAAWRVYQAGIDPGKRVEDIQAVIDGLVEQYAFRRGHTVAEVNELMALHRDGFREWLRQNAPKWGMVEIGPFRVGPAAKRDFRYGRSGMEYTSKGTGPAKPGDEKVYGAIVKVDKDGEDVLEAVTSPQALTQSANFVGLVDPEMLKAWSHAIQLRRALDEGRNTIGAAVTSGYATTWAMAAASSVLWPVHRLWKWSVLTLAAPRYVLRITLEEKTRAQVAQGMGPAFAIGATARRASDHMMAVEREGFGSWSGIGLEEVPDYFAYKHWARGGDTQVIEQGEAGFEENLWHLLNRQVNPDSESVAHYMLGVLWREGTDEWDIAYRNAVEWLRSAEGRPYLAMYRSMNGAKDAEEVVQAFTEWARSIVRSDEVAQRRLGGLISLAEVRALAPGDLPIAVYGRPQIGGPLDVVKHPWKSLERMTFESGTTGLTRQPFAFIEYQRELRALTASGVPYPEASRLANLHAVRRTNQIMYDAGQRSVFAQKMELIFPFQSAREEQLRVAGRLLRERPAAAAATYIRYARLFSQGTHAENSPLVQDDFGEWRVRLKIPEAVEGVARWYADIAPDWVPFDAAAKEVGYGRALEDLELSFKLRDIFMTLPLEAARIGDNLFLQYVAGAFIPTPGGPWYSSGMAVALSTHPELYPHKSMLRRWLFPAGPPLGVRPHELEPEQLLTAVIGRPEARYLLGALVGGGWSTRENNVLADKMVRELYFRLGRTPTAEEVEQALRGAFALKFFFGLFIPAASQQTYAGQLEFQRQIDRYTRDGEVQWGMLLTNHPELVPYVNRYDFAKDVGDYQKRYGKDWWNRLKADNPDRAKALLVNLSVEDWRDLTSEEEWAAFVGSRSVMDPAAYRKVLDDAAKLGEMFTERRAIGDLLDPYERVDAIREWERKWSDEPAWAKMKELYDRDIEFDAIMSLPAGDRRVELEAWRVGNNVSQAKFDGYTADWRAGLRHKNLWAEARTFDQIDELWRETKGMDAETFAREKLTPAEAIKWVENQMRLTDDLDEFWKYYGIRRETYDKYHEELGSKNPAYRDGELAAKTYWEERKDNVGSRLGHLNGQLDAVNAKLSKLFEKLEWAKANHVWVDGLGAQIKQLTSQRTALYAQKKALNDSLYNTVPILHDVHDEIRLMRAYRNWEEMGRAGSPLDFRRMGFDTEEGFEERRFAWMPPHVQEETIRDLRDRLNQASGRGRLEWDWLTNFQKDLLRDSWMVDKDTIEKWKRMQADGDGGTGARGRGRWSRWKRYEWKVWGHRLGDGFGELAFALEMFKQYSRREGMAAPQAELDELKKIGDNPVLRAEYIRTHPRLQAWFRAGPMFNMPPGVAEIVRFIMTKYGRWDDTVEGGAATYNDAIEIGFARTQLAQYTKRKPGEQAPRAYELWLKMPSGKKKASYLELHPEIGRWLQRGPMANMPEPYQEVVRDIMFRYGLWTERQDPMSTLMEQFSELPTYARDEFLQKHPELVAYWRALRTGRERQLFDLAQRYFTIKDPSTKQAFAASHPELQEYFANERHRRYEQFLRLVAKTLGDYPDLAKQYLADQTAYIKVLVDRWGMRPLVAETASVTSRPALRD
jgi:hypothetical protein